MGESGTSWSHACIWVCVYGQLVFVFVCLHMRGTACDREQSRRQRAQPPASIEMHSLISIVWTAAVHCSISRALLVFSHPVHNLLLFTLRAITCEGTHLEQHHKAPESNTGAVTLSSVGKAFYGSWIMFAVTHQYKWSDLNSLGVRETLFRQLPGTNTVGRDEVESWEEIWAKTE